MKYSVVFASPASRSTDGSHLTTLLARLREQFDTSTALGRLLLNLLAALAEFELELIRERVKAGMDRARRQGRQIGRPRVMDRKGFKKRFGAILERLNGGSISRRQAAKELNIGYATLKRLLDAQSSRRAD